MLGVYARNLALRLGLLIEVLPERRDHEIRDVLCCVDILLRLVERLRTNCLRPLVARTHAINFFFGKFNKLNPQLNVVCMGIEI